MIVGIVVPVTRPRVRWSSRDPHQPGLIFVQFETVDGRYAQELSTHGTHRAAGVGDRCGDCRLSAESTGVVRFERYQMLLGSSVGGPTVPDVI